MTLPLYERVVLVQDVPEYGLQAGDVGTIVDQHVGTDASIGYSVEFFDITGRTVAVVVLDAQQVRQPTHQEVLSARRRVA